MDESLRNRHPMFPRLAKRLAPDETLVWEAVYAEELPRVYNFFRYRVGDDQAAEDLTAATFERAWRARHRYQRDRGAFSAWLFGIARRQAIDYFKGRPPEVSLDLAEHVTSDHGQPERIASQNADFARLHGLLDELPERERELIALKYGAGLTNRQIAGAVSMTESNVGTILHRAVHKLRAEWERDDD